MTASLLASTMTGWRHAGVISDIEAGHILIGGIEGHIEPTLAEAEALAAQLDRTEGCGLEFYRSVIAAEVGRLLDLVLSDPDITALHIGWVLLTRRACRRDRHLRRRAGIRP